MSKFIFVLCIFLPILVGAKETQQQHCLSFHYHDKVKISNGFYKGLEGLVDSVDNCDFVVLTTNTDSTMRLVIAGKDLEKIK